MVTDDLDVARLNRRVRELEELLVSVSDTRDAALAVAKEATEAAVAMAALVVTLAKGAAT